MTVFKVSKQFTNLPGGRYRKHGEGSGEELRDDYLLPLIDKLPEGEKLTVDLSDTMGCCASMLEETFGGLVRRRGEEVVGKVEVVSDDEEEIEKANQFMREQVERGGVETDENWTEKKDNKKKRK